MRQYSALLAASILLTGCATTTPPPERSQWDDAPASTVCTDTTSDVNLQSAGAIILGGAGGWDIGAGLALGYTPILGIGLASVGLLSAIDSDKKRAEIIKCQEFKEFVALRDQPSHNQNTPNTTQQSNSERLRELNSLYDDGLISEDEFQSKRREILSDM